MKLKILLLSFLAVFLLAGSSFAYTIDDDYIGADPTNNSWWGEDRIGNVDDFEIYGMNVIFSPNFTVSIHSTFFDSSIELNRFGVKLGDLFISTNGWNPNRDKNGSHGVQPETSYDNAVSSPHEDWEYVMVLDDHSGVGTSGKAELYAVKAAGIVLSKDWWTAMDSNPNWVYRANQEIQYSPGQEVVLGLGEWNYGNEWLIIEIPAIQAFNGVSEFGFHYAMTCANDVIEGSAPVPEPATMLLLGSGLIGLAAFGRKKFRKNNNS